MGNGWPGGRGVEGRTKPHSKGRLDGTIACRRRRDFEAYSPCKNGLHNCLSSVSMTMGREGQLVAGWAVDFIVREARRGGDGGMRGWGKVEGVAATRASEGARKVGFSLL